MSLEGVYDEDNIFARIIRGEAPSVKVWENDDVLVFMDVFPQAKGHTLVVHKASKARNLLDAEPPTLTAVMAAAQKTARAIVAALKPDGVVVTQFNGAPAGQTVFHLHVHVIPRWEGQAFGRHGQGMADVEELKALAARIAGAME